MATPSQQARRPRADARRNKERVLAAARKVFAERGVDAPMAAVARGAGVGVATLYRHFPTREALVRGAFAQQLEACSRALTEALEAPDPWQGFQDLFRTICRLQCEERGFSEAFLASNPGYAVHLAGARGRAESELESLLRRAQARGGLRPDFHLSDFVMAIVAHGGMVSALPPEARASERFVAYLLDAFRADPGERRLPPPSGLTLSDLFSGHDVTQAGGSGLHYEAGYRSSGENRSHNRAP